MELTITVGELLKFLLYTGLIVLIVFAVIMVKNLTITIKNTNKVLEDTKKITEIAAKRATDVDGLLDGAVESVSGLTKSLKDAEQVKKSVVGLAKACNSIVKIFNKDGGK
jgi:hypothetical protein